MPTAAENADALQSAVPLRCMNCASPLTGNFCAHCGQEAKIETPTVGEFVREFLQDQMALEGKLLLSLRVLVGVPGKLTLDYINGMRQRYIRPLRLYLTLSVVYFALAGFSGNGPSSPAPAKKTDAAMATTPQTASDADRDSNDADDDMPPKAARSRSAPEAPPAAVAPSRETNQPGQSKNNTEQSDADKRDQARAKSSAGLKWDHREGVDAQDYDQLRDFKTGYLPLDTRIKRFFDRPQQRAMGDFSTALRNDAPVAIFFVLPLFAALLQIGYLRHHLRYGVHLLFSLHFHAFVFLDLLLSILPWPGIVEGALKIAIPVYLVMALRRVYGGGAWSTGFFVLLMLLLYSIFIGIALVLAAAVSVAFNS